MPSLLLENIMSIERWDPLVHTASYHSAECQEGNLMLEVRAQRHS